MNHKMKPLSIVFELLKWGLIVFLVFPVFQRDLPNSYDFPKIILGMLLLVLYIGKMFYDLMLDKHGEQIPLWLELLRMLGVIVLIAVIIAAIMLFVGLYIYLKHESM